MSCLKFLLFPGQFWKHRNHLTVFRAISLLSERGINDAVLVCTGFVHDYRFPNYATKLDEFLVTHRLKSVVRVLGLIPRHDQGQLMRAPRPGLSRLPCWKDGAVLEEGRSLGKTVFASDIPMHREQLAERVHLFDPTSSEFLADLLSRHWPVLTPGPDPKLETLAEVKYEVGIREFTREFVTLCRSAEITTLNRPACRGIKLRPPYGVQDFAGSSIIAAHAALPRDRIQPAFVIDSYGFHGVRQPSRNPPAICAGVVHLNQI